VVVFFYLGHDRVVELDFRLGPVDLFDLHVEQKNFSGHEFPAGKSSRTVGFVLDVEVSVRSVKAKTKSNQKW
jgi:hypothetical protein